MMTFAPTDPLEVVHFDARLDDIYLGSHDATVVFRTDLRQVERLVKLIGSECSVGLIVEEQAQAPTRREPAARA